MTEQQPDKSAEDLGQTRAFQPIDPYGVGDYGDFRPEAIGLAGGSDHRDGDDDDDDGADGPYPGLKERIAAFGKARAALVAAAVVLVVGGVAWGTSAALASSSAGTPNPGTAAVGPTTAGQQSPKPMAKAARVTITAVSATSFTGTEAKGKTVTVVYGDDTKFGNKARPLAPAELTVGMTVTVLGEQSGDTITATSIGMPVKKGPAAPGTETADPSSAASAATSTASSG